MSTKTAVLDDEIKRLWSKVEATELFRPAGHELRCSIDRVFSDADVAKILSLCEEVVATITKHGLKE